MVKSNSIKQASFNDIPILIPTLLELRRHRVHSEIETMLKRMMLEGYQVAFMGNGEIVYSIIGFRITEYLFSGKTLYIDDLITNSNYRKKGFATALMKWIISYAKEKECSHISLDSGIARTDAHKLYLNSGLIIESIHFGQKIANLL